MRQWSRELQSRWADRSKGSIKKSD